LYNWYLNTNSNYFSSDQEFAYQSVMYDSVIFLEVSNGFCYLYDSVSLVVYQRPPQFLMPDSTLCFGDTLWWIISDTIHESLLWEDGSTDSIRVISQTGVYNIEVSNGVCHWSDSADITILPPDAALFVPNVVTPNGDGINDEFCFYAPRPDEFNIVVYNRWGETLYESENSDDCWDLRYKGTRISEGTYFWLARFKSECSDSVEEMQGTLTVIGED